MDYAFGCECGNRISVTERSAGSIVACTCGGAIAIPSLRQLQGLDPSQVYPIQPVATAELADSPRDTDEPSESGPLWPRRSLSEAEQATQAHADLEYLADWADEMRGASNRNMAVGGLICVAGVAITAATYSAAAPGGTYIVAWGAIVFGAIQFVKGLTRS